MYILGDDLGFIAHPRMGSRSIADSMLSLGAERKNNHHEMDDMAVREVYAQNGIVACTVRNMFDVVVSWYHNPTRHHDARWSFDEYVSNFILRDSPVNRRWFVYPIYHYALPFCTFKLRYEKLEEDWQHLMSIYGHRPMMLPHIGKSDRKPYQEYYSDWSRGVIEKRWADDLRLTGYSF